MCSTVEKAGLQRGEGGKGEGLRRRGGRSEGVRGEKERSHAQTEKQRQGHK